MLYLLPIVNISLSKEDFSMIKKLKNWYCHLLPFKKVRLLGRGVGIITYLFLFFWLLPHLSSFVNFFIALLIICPYFAIVGYGLVYLFFRPDIAEAKYKEDIRKQKQQQEQKAELDNWFSSSTCLKVAMKSSVSSFDILLFYYQKHLLVNTFYIEQNVIDGKTFYSISADCQGLEERVVFSDTIEDPAYILERFTLDY